MHPLEEEEESDDKNNRTTRLSGNKRMPNYPSINMFHFDGLPEN